MRQFSAKVLDRVFGPLLNLFSPPGGRHSSAAGWRRSARVRRYVPEPATAPISAAPERTSPPRVPEPAPVPPSPAPALVRVPTPRAAPVPDRLPVDELALVRTYYAAHERELDRIQAEATARMYGWAHRDVPPSGDLLAPDPVPSTTPAHVGAPVLHVAPPQVTAPARKAPDDWRTLTRLVRVWLEQQERRRKQTWARVRVRTWEQRAAVAA
ncbi:hypothetical protein ACFWTE_12715 [Nocardiopsis sp. NPDC058631]|uniref:hypothetical protein n=1 Tax=Nocardiopsis sp. NPDC058631 TaxID=3346566 RepID=UPI00364C68D2